MKPKTLASLYALMGAVAFSSTPDLSSGIREENCSKTSTKEEINKSKGLKEFIIDGNSYWAINYKNALKKHNKLKTK